MSLAFYSFNQNIPFEGEMQMKYSQEIQASSNAPEQLEKLYQAARQANDEQEFRLDIQSAYENAPENILLSAWHARFEHLPLAKAKRVTNWALAVVLGVVTGLVLWAISDPTQLFIGQVPYLLMFWAPIATIPVIIFLTAISKRNYLFATVAVLSLIAAGLYVWLVTPQISQTTGKYYLILMVFQLPLLCWIALGIAVMKFRSSEGNRFAFLTKSIEVMITAGVYLIFGVAFGLITLGMFAALSVTPPEIIIRLVGAGGFGLIPILAVATMYDPTVLPEAQDFSLGLSKFVFTMMRLLLPLTLLVLVIYIFVIPFNFLAPFQNRDLLIVYNVMQFAIIGLLIGATPLKLDELSPNLQKWLRWGIMAVSILALLISLYALSAVAYRTAIDRLTLNRLTIIGWNVINIAILGMMIYTQFNKVASSWHERLQRVFSKATGAYLAWSVFSILALPWIFR
jgi:hypothetical protein